MKITLVFEQAFPYPGERSISKTTHNICEDEPWTRRSSLVQAHLESSLQECLSDTSIGHDIATAPLNCRKIVQADGF
jgi:hypothetical protein